MISPGIGFSAHFDETEKYLCWCIWESPCATPGSVNHRSHSVIQVLALVFSPVKISGAGKVNFGVLLVRGFSGAGKVNFGVLLCAAAMVIGSFGGFGGGDGGRCGRGALLSGSVIDVSRVVLIFLAIQSF